VVCALGSVAPLASPAWGSLIGARIVEGLGFMVVAVASPALVTAASTAADRRFALGLWSTYMPAGASLAMASAPWLLPRTGWRGLWLLTAAGLLLAASALWAQRRAFGPGARPGHRHGDTRFWTPVRAALGQPLPWLLALSFGLWATQHFALIVWMPTYLLEQRHLAAGPVALLTGLMLVACVPGNVIGGWLVQQGLPRGALLAGAHVLTGLGAITYAQEAWPDGLRYAAAVFVSFAGGLIPAAVMASSTVLARDPQQIGTLQGLYMQGAQIGQFIGTPLIAAVVAATGRWPAAQWVTLPAALGGVLLGLWALRLEARLSSAPVRPAEGTAVT